MIKQFSLVFAAVLLLGYMELSHQQPQFATLEPESELCWTKWFNRDGPSGTGDWETLKDLREKYPGEICRSPKEIQAVTADNGTPAEKTNQKFYAYDTVTGFICRNKDQKHGRCFDYKVRFKCPCSS